MVALRGMVLFPKMVLHFDIGRDKSVEALNQAMTQDRKIFLAAQKELLAENPTWDGLYKVGVVGRIKQVLKAKGNLLLWQIKEGDILKIYYVKLPNFLRNVLKKALKQ